MVTGKRIFNPSADIDLALETDFAMMNLDDLFDDCQAQARPGNVFGLAVVATIETVKDVREVLRCDADARVFDREQDGGVAL